jgi:single-strand DNA-binding protein
MNKVFLIGRLTKDPEIRVTPNGKKVASFTIAINEGKDADGQELVQFFNCSAWERLAEIIEAYVPKGTKVAIVGSLRNRSWDKPDGTKGYATEVLVREMEILSSKAEIENFKQATETSASQASPSETKKINQNPIPEDDLPEIDVEQLNVQMPF